MRGGAAKLTRCVGCGTIFKVEVGCAKCKEKKVYRNRSSSNTSNDTVPSGEETDARDTKLLKIAGEMAKDVCKAMMKREKKSKKRSRDAWQSGEEENDEEKELDAPDAWDKMSFGETVAEMSYLVRPLEMPVAQLRGDARNWAEDFNTRRLKNESTRTDVMKLQKKYEAHGVTAETKLRYEVNLIWFKRMFLENESRM